MRITVRCFASVRELFGKDQLEVELPEGATVADLEARLAQQAPALRRLPFVRAVNLAYCQPDRVLEEGDVVALIPPVSGGEEPDVAFELTHAPLDARPLERVVRTDQDGAVVTFAGVTRDHNEGQRVTGLAYEAYAEMALKVVLAILEDARREFAIGRVRVAHRLGPVAIGEASVLVVVAAPHRDPAFDACRYVMDRVKSEAPIFKRESLQGGDGGARWVGELPEV